MESGSFRDRLVRAYEASGLSKEELWQKSGVSFHVIEQLLDGKIMTTTTKNSEALAAALGIGSSMDGASQADSITSDKLESILEVNEIQKSRLNYKPYAEIGARLKSFRELLGLSQTQFCEKLNGVGQGKYSRWEDGTSLLSLNGALEMSRVHGLSLDAIFLGKDELESFDAAQNEQEKSLLKLFSMLSPEERPIILKAIKGVINSRAQ